MSEATEIEARMRMQYQLGYNTGISDAVAIVGDYAGKHSAIAGAVRERLGYASAPAHEWKPISTAPKDGTPILGFWSYIYTGDVYPTQGIEIIEWDESGKIIGWLDRDGVADDSVYTHWMPLPDAPDNHQKGE